MYGLALFRYDLITTDMAGFYEPAERHMSK